MFSRVVKIVPTTQIYFNKFGSGEGVSQMAILKKGIPSIP